MMEKGSNKDPIDDHFNFWKWLLRKGIRQFFDRWLFFHILVGFVFQLIINKPLYEIAIKAFVPFAALLVGLVFAWSGSIASILQSQEMDEIRRYNGFETFKDYVYSFQLATLVNFALIILWVFIGLNPFKGYLVSIYTYTLLRALVFAFSSLVVRECWNLILRLQLHLISIALIRDAKKKKVGQSLFKMVSKLKILKNK